MVAMNEERDMDSFLQLASHSDLDKVPHGRPFWEFFT